VGAHRGYLRLANGVIVVRSIVLDGRSHRLTVLDQFEGRGDHEVSIPLQLCDRATVDSDGAAVTVLVDGSRFAVRAGDAQAWAFSIEPGWISPSYGVKRAAPRLVWTRSGPLRALQIEIEPAA
jgi:hypothetical protein